MEPYVLSFNKIKLIKVKSHQMHLSLKRFYKNYAQVQKHNFHKNLLAAIMNHIYIYTLFLTTFWLNYIYL